MNDRRLSFTSSRVSKQAQTYSESVVNLEGLLALLELQVAGVDLALGGRGGELPRGDEGSASRQGHRGHLGSEVLGSRSSRSRMVKASQRNRLTKLNAMADNNLGSEFRKRARAKPKPKNILGSNFN